MQQIVWVVAVAAIAVAGWPALTHILPEPPTANPDKIAYRDTYSLRSLIAVCSAAALTMITATAWAPAPTWPTWALLATIGAWVAVIDAITTWIPAVLAWTGWAGWIGGCSRYRPLGPYCGDTCCHRYRHHLRSVDDRLAHLPRRLRLLRRAHHTTVGSPGRSNRHRHDPGHCHSRPHPDRPICPNRPVPTPHHPIPPLGTQPVQRRPHRPSHRPLTPSRKRH